MSESVEPAGKPDVPDHIMQSAQELEATAMELLPKVVALADQYAQLSWSPELHGFDIEDPTGGEKVAEHHLTASAILGAMILVLRSANSDRTPPESFDQLDPRIVEQVPEYQRLHDDDLQRDRWLIDTGRQLERGELD